MGPVAVAGRVVSALILGVGGFLAVRAITTPDLVASADSGSVAWIDTPLNGTEMMPATVQVTGHGTDPSGVIGLTLLVDGATIQTIQTSGGALETGHFTWPATAGHHQLVVRLSSVSGSETASAPIYVTILDRMPETEPDPTTSTIGTTSTIPESTTTTLEPATTTTVAPTTTTPPATTTTTTPGPTTTTAPATTTTTCPIAAPTLVDPPNGYITSPFFPAPPLTWSYAGCPITQFVVEVARDTAFTVDLQTQTFGPTVFQWNVVNGLAQGPWYWRVRASNGAQVGPWSTTWIFTKG